MRLKTLLSYFKAVDKVKEKKQYRLGSSDPVDYYTPSGCDATVLIDGEAQAHCNGIMYNIHKDASKITATGSITFYHPNSPGLSLMRGMHTVDIVFMSELGVALEHILFKQVSFVNIDSSVMVDDITVEEDHCFLAKEVQYGKLPPAPRSITY